MGALPAYSVVVPVFNEAEVLPEFHRRLGNVMAGLGATWEVVYVDDGSRDASPDILRGLLAAHPEVAVLLLSRNFGKEIAMTAGLDHARGAAVIVIDADLQDPPELIPELAAIQHQGYDVVYAQRRRREGESWVKRTTARAFYRLMQRVGGVTLPRDTGDFRIMSRRAVDALGGLRERHRFMKGLFAWIGFPSRALLYDRAPRFAGRTKWNYWRLWNLALEGVTSFTVFPLKLSSYLGLAIAVMAAIYGVFILTMTILHGNPVAGYPSLLVVVLFLGGTQMMILGVIGEYLGRIFNETKHRPLYLVQEYSAPSSARGLAEEGTAGNSATESGAGTAAASAHPGA